MKMPKALHMTEKNDGNRFGQFIHKLKSHLVTDVPIELDACEDCRATECSHDKLIHCENRINRAKRIEADLNRKYGES